MKKTLTTSLAAAALSLSAATMPASEMVLQPKSMRLHIEQTSSRGLNKRQKRRLETKARNRHQRRKEASQGFFRNMANKIRLGAGVDKQKSIINSMTNWQRNQWAKAGYPADASQFANAIR